MKKMKLRGIPAAVLLQAALFCPGVCTQRVHAQMQLENAFPGLSFIRPVDFQAPDDDSDRLFVLEQPGKIFVFDNDRNAAQKELFLDIRDRVTSSGNEEGLLGLAFHPDYKNNGYFYVDYTASNPGRTVVARYQVSQTNADSALKDSELIILEVDQPYANHNAGQIVFGPDGYLYITLGDGGSSGDPDGNAQNRSTLLGSILRIDVNQTGAGLNYAIPQDNPFKDNQSGYREELYAYGLRNPWRMSFDPQTGLLWAGDVGQNQYEEINIIRMGANYGWNIMEGFHCYNAAECDTSGLTMPVLEYSHDVGQSITGGTVYRGTRVPELAGRYVYADYVSGRIWALDYDSSDTVSVELLADTYLNIASFGTDRDQRLYILAFDGSIYRFKTDASHTRNRTNMHPQRLRMSPNFPNPFNAVTSISYRLYRSSRVLLRILDSGGRAVTTLVDEIQPAGEKTVRWDGFDQQNRSVASGTYLCSLEAGGTRRIQKITFIK